MPDKIDFDQLFDEAIKATKGRVVVTVNPEDLVKATQAVANITQAHVLYVANGKALAMESEIASVLERVRPPLVAIDMMKATQSVLNLMQANVRAAEGKQTKSK